MAHFEKQLTSDTKFQGRIFTVTVDDIELENGEPHCAVPPRQA